MKFLFLLSLVALACSMRRFDGDQVLTLYPKTQKHLDLIREFDSFNTLADFWSPDNVDAVRVGGSVDIRFNSANLRVVKRKIALAHMNYDVKIDNLQAVINYQFTKPRPRDTKAYDYYVYHTYEEISQWTYDMAAEYPALVSRETLITSEEGREIPQLILGRPLADNKPIVLIDCGMHAREWITPAFCQCYVNRMLSNYGTDAEITRTLDDFTIAVFPLLNVDGYKYSWTNDRMWRKTRSNYGTVCTGVDPNRNFDANWAGPGASSNPCSETYYGPVVESENLTVGLSNFIRNNKGRIEAYLTFHSYSQIVLFPYSYARQDVDNKDEHNELAANMVSALKSVNGITFTYGAGYEILYLAAGGSDDMAKDNSVPLSYTIELRDEGRYGFLLPEDLIEPSCNETYELVDEVFSYIADKLFGSK